MYEYNQAQNIIQLLEKINGNNFADNCLLNDAKNMLRDMIERYEHREEQKQPYQTRLKKIYV